jgi:hypothetical protein
MTRQTYQDCWWGKTLRIEGAVVSDETSDWVEPGESVGNLYESR